MTHTEIVHVYFGLAMAVMAGTVLWAWRRPTSIARFVWPVLAFLIGFYLFIPAETETGTYARTGWLETFLDAYPEDFKTWFAMFAKVHVAQHKAAGLLAMAIGLIELGRAAGRLTAPFWGRLLPFVSIAVGLTLSIHGGTHQHLPHSVEQLHHWILGGCFVSAGIVLALHQAGRLRATVWRDLWGVLVILAGLDMLVFYRLP